ncbi:unnamed protein product [Caenorhabditis auriculariae]|uniref:RING-type domain-containing protein n=1 Tax=Caenorhabditis auriculariae TaxID=2777116 RepID=A0A8S1HGM5_9PELO|nr:unnamed protein product [Caenorhabditis auriculariae]
MFDAFVTTSRRLPFAPRAVFASHPPPSSSLSAGVVGLKVNGCFREDAKQNMQAGVKLYHQRHYAHAINKWKQALNRLSNVEDRFITLGYLAQALCDQGDYEGMLSFALHQMQLATDRADATMKCEAFLNLAKAYERLADFTKALQYGKASLEHPSMDPRTPGYAHLTIALAYLGMSQFQASLESFEQSMNVANETSDRLLELQICVGLGSLFTLLRDVTKALIFLRNALAIVQAVTVEDVHAKYRCLILYHLSVALRIKGSLVDAKEACDEASQLATEMGNRSLHARCMCSLADVYRELGESEAKETITKSWARYEEAYRVMRGANDRMGEVLVLASMAKSASESRSHYTGQCECQAIQLNKKCIEIANHIGCKHVVLKCHLRLAELYSQLNDDDSEETARRAASRLTQEMQLFCNFCGQRYGTKDESLQALRCSHIFHEKCLHTYLTQRSDQTCPKCRCRAVLSDNISVRSSIASTADLQSPSTSFGPPAGGVRTPLADVADLTPTATLTRPDRILRGAEKDIDRVDKTLARLSSKAQDSLDAKPPPSPNSQLPSSNASALNHKPPPPPPPRKPCCSQAALPPSSIVALPPAMPLAEDGPLVISLTPTVTDVQIIHLILKTPHRKDFLRTSSSIQPTTMRRFLGNLCVFLVFLLAVALSLLILLAENTRELEISSKALLSEFQELERTTWAELLASNEEFRGKRKATTPKEMRRSSRKQRSDTKVDLEEIVRTGKEEHGYQTKPEEQDKSEPTSKDDDAEKSEGQEELEDDCDKDDYACRTSHCPRGPPGLPGADGLPGEDGANGTDAADGSEWSLGENDQVVVIGCVKCPPGPRGVEGDPGPPGYLGRSGEDGAPGLVGFEGFPGKPGVQGEQGYDGPIGPPGRQGAPGESVQSFYNPPGAPGRPGIAGRPGKRGKRGTFGVAGSPGAAGSPGKSGVHGVPGPPGAPGTPGESGRPGQPGKPCFCPSANTYKVPVESSYASAYQRIYIQVTPAYVEPTTTTSPPNIYRYYVKSPADPINNVAPPTITGYTQSEYKYAEKKPEIVPNKPETIDGPPVIDTVYESVHPPATPVDFAAE